MIEIGLLDYLSWKAGCACLSDLRYQSGRARLRCALEKLPPGQCQEAEWVEAARYLTRRDFETAEEARDALLQWAGRTAEGAAVLETEGREI